MTSSVLDDVIKEVISYGLYKRGKEPIVGYDPRPRIKRSIWKDEGVDITVLEKTGIGKRPPSSTEPLFQLLDLQVKEGMFRKRREHVLISGLNSIEELKETLSIHLQEKDPTLLLLLTGSELMFPVVLYRSSEELREFHQELRMERTKQREMPDISQRGIFNALSLIGPGKGGSKGLSSLFRRKIPKTSWIKVPGGIVIKDLMSLVRAVIEMSDRYLDDLISKRALIEIARDGLKSPNLEGLFSDLSLDPKGEQESAANFRIRLGRILMDSDAAEMVFITITQPILERFVTCSAGEARKLEGFLDPLMDPRSTPVLKGLVFQAPASNRSNIIRLMGRTGDRALVETLRKIHSFSTLEEDQKEAKNALEELGAKMDQ